MNRFLLYALALLGAMCLWVTPTALAGPPPRPYGLWGALTIDGAPAPTGTLLTAWIGAAPVQTLTVSYAGVYSLDIKGDNEDTPWVDGGAEGDTVNLKIRGMLVPQAGVWHEGVVERLDLSAPGAYFAPPTLWRAEFGAEAGGWASQEQYPRALGDANADGRADVVGFGGSGVYVSRSTGDAFGPMARWSADFGYGPSAGGWTSQNIYPRGVADVNGDGRADIVGFGALGVYVARSTGTGFGPLSRWSAAFGAAPAAGGWSDQNTYPRLLADVNGDHKADVVGFGGLGVFVALSTGSSFGAMSRWSTDFGAAPAAGGWTSQDAYPRLLGDMNRDGYADIVGFGGLGVYVSLANGTRFGPMSRWSASFGAAPGSGGWTSQELYPRTVGDLDGDGQADVVGLGGAGAYLALSTGSALGPMKPGLSSFGSSPVAGGWSSQNLYPRAVADVSGDGQGDLVGFWAQGVQVGGYLR